MARLLKAVGLAGLVAFLSTGCSAHQVLSFGWPEGVTPQAERIRALWIWSTLAALVVGGIVFGLILWTVAFHRKRSDDMPRQTQYNLPLEIVYTVIPFVIVAVLFYFTATTQNYVNAKLEDPALRVQVVGFQWNWEFQYLQNQPGVNGEFPVRMTQVGTPISTVGSTTTVPILVLPTNRVVEYRVESKDVIHSFFIPEFLFKRDVFPRPDKNETDNVFQTRIDRTGAFVGRCAELCGTYHSMMNFEVRALPGDLFDRYLDVRARTNPQTGVPYTAGEALARLGCGDLCAPEAVTTSPFQAGRTSPQSFGRN
ncbi:MAG TPA: cytochrome c oxidase subunit II [Pseudonocardiaceae bacterium]|nr:cytochrome c oxidase subunit II [Pseudonocardiaceae bacterium]